MFRTRRQPCVNRGCAYRPGFLGSHCTPALYALESRLCAHIDPIPAWPLRATLYAGPPADLAARMGDVYLSCYGNDRQEGGLCFPVLGAIYLAQHKGYVEVWVDGE